MKIIVIGDSILKGAVTGTDSGHLFDIIENSSLNLAQKALGFESAFDFVVVAAAADYVYVEVAGGGVYEALPEVFKAVGLEGAFLAVLNRNKRDSCEVCVIYKVWASAKVYCCLNKAFVHRVDEKS